MIVNWISWRAFRIFIGGGGFLRTNFHSYQINIAIRKKNWSYRRKFLSFGRNIWRPEEKCLWIVENFVKFKILFIGKINSLISMKYFFLLKRDWHSAEGPIFYVFCLKITSRFCCAIFKGGGQMILWPLFGQLGPWPPGPPLCAPMIEFLLANWIWSPSKLITIRLIR